jgi:ATP-binding cassette subfamily F protein 3
MIAANGLGIQFGGDYLFRDASFMISPGDRVGLVGANGTGKTTLLRILIGQQTPDDGSISTTKHAVIGYLPQEGIVLSGTTVRDEVMTAFGELLEMEREIEALTSEVARRSHEHETPEFASLLEDLGELQHRYDGMSGFSAMGELEKVLMGLGFEPSDLDRPCREFSGGWQMRIELAKLLLRQPDLLMLDEPTNHLDIESLVWLEGFLQRYQGSLLMISHDRTFLDAVTNRTFELSMRRLTTYTGNFSRYLVDREARRELQQSAYENQQKQISEQEKFIERFRYKATKARQVQSRVKALDRLERIDAVESDESSVHFRFPPASRSGRLVVELKGLHKSYGENHVLRGVDFALERGEKLAFLGRNGEGKSTLSRIIAGIEGFQSGERIVGHNVEIGYFAQHQAESLDPRKTVLETLDSVATGDIRLKLRNLLGAFLFNGDDVFKKVAVLSGGEKSRLALAKLMLEPVNLLVFDEPTNHLDMASKEVLKGALMRFDGSMIIVSHDRDFLNGIVDKCIDFRGGGIKEYLGGIDDYLARHKSATVDDIFRKEKGNGGGAQQQQQSQQKPDDGLSPKERKRIEAERRNRRHAATKELRKQLETTEKKIAELETTKSESEALMAGVEVYNDPDRLRTTKKLLADTERDLAKEYDIWSRVASQIELVESELE